MFSVFIVVQLSNYLYIVLIISFVSNQLEHINSHVIAYVHLVHSSSEKMGIKLELNSIIVAIYLVC